MAIARMFGPLATRKFWYPVNVDWAEFEKRGEQLPGLPDMVLAFLLALVLTGLRKVLEAVLFKPMARRCIPEQYAAATVVLPVEAQHPELAEAFSRQSRPSKADINSLARAVQLPDSTVSTFFAQRRKKWRGQIALAKWCDSFWQFTYYTAATIYGASICIDTPWYRDTKQSWVDYPLLQAGTEVKAYYLISLAVYIHFLLVQVTDKSVRYKDFWEMFIHHLCTIFLISFSYLINFWRLGSLVLLLHDVSDPFRELGKLFLYSKKQRLCDIMFISFAAVFGYTRLYLFPRYVIYSTAVESYELLGPYGAWYVFIFLLLVLQVLHAYWMFLILRMMYFFAVKGNVEKDDRSHTEDSEEEANANGSKSPTNTSAKTTQTAKKLQ